MAEEDSDWETRGRGCACDPESALRIQFLRLLHNFVSRESPNLVNKRLLLTPAELESVGVMEGGTPPSDSCGDGGAQGLLAKVVRVMLKQPAESQYRFWLSTCIEAFLRGSSPPHQAFVAQTGLLQMLVHEIAPLHAARSFQHVQPPQPSFDLLGELLKFHPTILSRFDALLSEGDRLARLMAVARANLVDSNVFLRALVLSFSSFGLGASEEVVVSQRYDDDNDQHDKKRGHLLNSGLIDVTIGERVERKTAIAAAVERRTDTAMVVVQPEELCNYGVAQSLLDQRVAILSGLMSVVSIHDISQENICCLNTALLFFIVARDARGLLTALMHHAHAHARQNFRSLLQFWQAYYCAPQKARDCASLEFSSSVPFRIWDRVVTELVYALA